MSIASTAVAQGAAPWGEVHPDAEIVTAPVEVDGRVLFNVRGVTSFPAEARAAAIAARIERYASDPAADAGVVQVIDSTTHTAINIGDKVLMTLFDADARVEQTEREDLAIANSERISEAISDYRRERTPEVLRKHTVEALAAMLALAL
ncbi:MAG: hypothetical protein KDI64_17685, partial [Candidatus Accumulibacter sp.]|nr:hypothetical protein [Accumulibacter sp.]